MTKRRSGKQKRSTTQRRSKPPVQLDAYGRGFCPGCLQDVPFDRKKMMFMRHEFTASGEPCNLDLHGYRFRTHDGHIISGVRANRIRAGDHKARLEEESSRLKAERFFKASGSKRTFLGGSMMSNRKKF